MDLDTASCQTPKTAASAVFTRFQRRRHYDVNHLVKVSPLVVGQLQRGQRQRYLRLQHEMSVAGMGRG